MADIQIPIGGEFVQVPEWAKESTLQSLLAVIKSNDQARNLVIQAMNVTADDIGKLERATDDLKKVEKETAYNQAQTIGDTVRNLSNRAVGVIQQLGDTSKPLSSMSNMAKQFKDTIASSDQTNKRAAGMIDSFTNATSGFGEKLVAGTGIVTDAFLAYGGFLAAKVEQFAEAQQNMIDSGAIFFENAQVFQHLREVSAQSGVGYQQMAKTINQYGRTVQALGDGVSGGSVVFAETFNQLNQANNAYGDFGQTSSEMLDTYAKYIDIMRLTGQSQQLLANDGAGLTTGYQQLMLENSALAAATSFNRKTLLDTTFEALSDVNFAASNKRIREKMGPEVADNIAALQSTFSLLGSQDPSKGGLGKFGVAFSKMIINAQQNMEQTGKFILGTNAEEQRLLAAVRGMEGGTELIEGIQRDIINPNFKASRTEILKRVGMLQEMEGNFIRADGTISGTLLDLNNAVAGFKNANDKLINMDEDAIAKLSDKTAQQLEAQGGVTEAINSAASLLLQAQIALTPNMVNMSDMIKNIADGFSSKNEIVTESEKRRRLEQDIADTTDPRRKRALKNQLRELNFDPFAKQEPVNVKPRPSNSRLASRWDRMYGDSHNYDGTPKQRFLGGYLGSNELALVGEEGPEMLVTDMPAYVKTMNQIGRNLGDAIKSHTTEDGIQTDHYAGGYRHVRSGSGTDLFDKDGNLLYNDSPKIGGYMKRTYAEGDIAEIYEGLPGGTTLHMFNGKRIGMEISHGAMTVAMIGSTAPVGENLQNTFDTGGSDSYFAMRYNMGNGVSLSAATMQQDGERSAVLNQEYNDPINGSYKMSDYFTPDQDQGPAGDVLRRINESAEKFKLALKHMTEQQHKNNIRASAEYE